MADPIDIRIDTQGTLERVRAELQAMPRGMERARKRAATKTRTWVRRQVLRAVSQSIGVPQKTISGLKRFAAVTDTAGGVRIWIGTNPLKAHHLGAVRWTRRMAGARAGRRSFPGSWSWGPGSRTGTAIMRRTGAGRLPVEVVTVPIHETVLARILGMEPEIGERYSTLLRQELNYALNHEQARGP